MAAEPERKEGWQIRKKRKQRRRRGERFATELGRLVQFPVGKQRLPLLT